MMIFVIKLLAIISLIGGMGVIGGIGYLVKNKLIREDEYWGRFLELTNNWGVRGAFFVALGSTIGSLFLSEIANFEACTLCWLQRGLMYPLVVILGIGPVQNLLAPKGSVLASQGRLYGVKVIKGIAIALSGLGAVLAGYQYYLQITHNPFAPCSTGLFAASCSDRYVNEFGFVTIPFMSLVGFLLITLLVYFSSAKVKKQ